MANVKVNLHEVSYPERVRRGVRRYAGLDSPTELHKDVRAAILYGKTGLTGYIKVTLGHTGKTTKDQRSEIDQARRLVVAWIFTDPAEVFAPLSSADLTPQQVNGISHWINEEVSPGVRRMRPTLIEELNWIMGRANTDLRLTLEATENGVNFTFGDCLAKWAQESPFDPDGDGDDFVHSWFSVDDFVNVGAEVIHERVQQESQKPKRAPTKAQPIKAEFELSDYF